MMPVRGIKTGPLEHDHLSELYSLGRKIYGGIRQDTGWDTDTLSGILLTALPTSLVAYRRKRLLGFVIAGPLERKTWKLYYHGARLGFEECLSDLLHYLINSLPEGTRLSAVVHTSEEEERLQKIGFTPTEILTTMTLFKK